MRLLDASDLDRARFTELERRVRARARRTHAIWPLVVYGLVLISLIGAIAVSVGRMHQ